VEEEKGEWSSAAVCVVVIVVVDVRRCGSEVVVDEDELDAITGE